MQPRVNRIPSMATLSEEEGDARTPGAVMESVEAQTSAAAAAAAALRPPPAPPVPSHLRKERVSKSRSHTAPLAPSRVVTSHSNTWDWLTAKTVVMCADANVQTIVSDYLQ